MDQIAARTLGQETQLASLELALESVELLGACDAGYSCAYANTIAWRTPTTPLPMENDPRAVFERLFGGSRQHRCRRAAGAARTAAKHSRFGRPTRSPALQRRLGARDNAKLDRVPGRGPRRRTPDSEGRGAEQPRELPVVEQPAGSPGTFEEHARLMFDLLMLAFQTDMTRVATFMLGARSERARLSRDWRARLAPSGVASPERSGQAGEARRRSTCSTRKQFAYFVERMAAAQDGDGSLLDHSMLLYGAGISDSNVHMHDNLPLVLVGGGAGRIKGGRHVRYPKDTPVTNLFLNMLDKLGVPADRIGDSTGRLEYLSDGLVRVRAFTSTQRPQSSLSPDWLSAVCGALRFLTARCKSRSSPSAALPRSASTAFPARRVRRAVS